ncbi:jupiter microtubule associated homolog 1a [Hypomesus transpacificus]|uniref:jupiter microtubule associated homolog 1a n=2 Tax=Osmeridae TaxID=8012 RepID=UPI001F07F935|nr:jupiter microtubule associated homolog 1a [Hypomesus transpacificus]
MTTTTTFQGMDPGSKSSSRVLRPPGGASNISFGAEEKPPARKDKMASSIFDEPEDPHAHRRNNPPGGKPTGVLCGEPSAPLRRGGGQPSNSSSGEAPAGDDDNDVGSADVCVEAEPAPEQRDEAPPSSGAQPGAAGLPSGRRNPPGGKSSLILG